jgi:hypothetical protein
MDRAAAGAVMSNVEFKPDGKNRYWIAISGPACALSMLPWRDPITAPVAEQMFGFPTYEDALDAQHIYLRKAAAMPIGYFGGFGSQARMPSCSLRRSNTAPSKF